MFVQYGYIKESKRQRSARNTGRARVRFCFILGLRLPSSVPCSCPVPRDSTWMDTDPHRTKGELSRRSVQY